MNPGAKINYFVYLRSILRTLAIRLEFFIRVYAYAYAVHKSDISIEIPYGFSCTVWYPYMYIYSCTVLARFMDAWRMIARADQIFGR